jgi:hypothetical protein
MNRSIMEGLYNAINTYVDSIKYYMWQQTTKELYMDAVGNTWDTWSDITYLYKSWLIINTSNQGTSNNILKRFLLSQGK